MNGLSSIPAAQHSSKRTSWMSLVIWGMIGLVVGIVVGAMAVDCRGAVGIGGQTADVQIRVFGVTIRQGEGPEPLADVAWTWGIGVLLLFGLVGSGISVGVRIAAEQLLAYHKP
jgi:hypothetical protein